MRITALAILLGLSCVLGCAKKQPAEAPAPPAEQGKGIEVEAPGVDVKVGGGEGVEVKTPEGETDVKVEPPAEPK
jgi:hypothetical protein